MALHIIKRGTDHVVYSGGTATSPKKPILTIPYAGIDSLSEEAFGSVTFNELKIIRLKMKEVTEAMHTETLLHAIQALETALVTTGKEVLSEVQAEQCESILNNAKRRVRSAVTKPAEVNVPEQSNAEVQNDTKTEAYNQAEEVGQNAEEPKGSRLKNLSTSE